MRTTAIVLLILVIGLLSNVAAFMVSPAYKDSIHALLGRSRENETVNPPPPSEMEKLSQTVEKLSIGIDALSASGAGIPVSVQTGSTDLPIGAVISATSTGTVPSANLPAKFPISWLLVTRLMPDVFLKEIPNKGIFDLQIFSGIDFTTYFDEKTKVKVYAFWESYTTMLSNLKLVSNVYTVNETDTFFDATFFLNSTNKRDSAVRFVTSLEGKAVGIEIPKTFYPKLKKLLTKK